jgi:hypothetical protein
LAYTLQKAFATKRRTIMATYVWELGIDWNASVKSLSTCYMPGGFIADDRVTRPVVLHGHQITFNIFNLRNNLDVTVESFTINPQPGAVGQLNKNPFSTLQPSLSKILSQPSLFFGESLPCWQGSVTVTSDPDQRFLLSFWVQATNLNPPADQPHNLLTFIKDPEMVVGPNM